MSAFRYKAVDPNGAEQRGVLEADSARHARTLLREQNLFPTDVTPATEASSARIHQWRAIRAGELHLVTRQWASLLKAGLPLEQSLSTLISQSDNERVSEVLTSVRAGIRAGQPLGLALAAQSRSFPAIYVALVRAGEKAGTLPEVLAQLSDYLTARQALQHKTTQALIYPVLMVIVSLLVAAGLLTYVVPQVAGVFAHQHQTLPLLTRMLIGLSEVIKWAGLPFLGVLIVAGFVLRRLWRQPTWRRNVERRLLSLPVLGQLLRAADTARFASTLAILVKSGVPLLSALEAGKAVVVRLPLQDVVDDAYREVREGAPLHRALAERGGFPPLLSHLVMSGEASGTLPAMLAQAAELQQLELDHRLSVLTSLLQPLLILLMGAMVLTIVLATLMPVFDIQQMLN